MLVGSIDTDLSNMEIPSKEYNPEEKEILKYFWKEISYDSVLLYLWCLNQIKYNSRAAFKSFSILMLNDSFINSLTISKINLIMIYFRKLKLSLNKEIKFVARLEKKKKSGNKIENKKYSNLDIFLNENTFSPNNELILQFYRVIEDKLKNILSNWDESHQGKNLKEWYGIIYSYINIKPVSSEIISELVPKVIP